MPLLNANGIRQHYATMGPFDDPGAPLAVLVHGVLIDSLASYYFTLAKPFADAGVATLMYDLRGHGKTDTPEDSYTLADYSADLIGLLDELGVRRPVFLLGNSLGGTLGLYVAAHHPDRVAGVVMIDAEAPVEGWGAKLKDVLDTAHDQLSRPEVIGWLRLRHGRHLAKQAKAALKTLTTTRIHQEMPYGAHLRADDLGALTVPVLCIYAGDSPIKDQEAELNAWLAHCTTTVVPGQDHSLLVDAPHEVCRLVLPWIETRHRALDSGAPTLSPPTLSHTPVSPVTPAADQVSTG